MNSACYRTLQLGCWLACLLGNVCSNACAQLPVKVAEVGMPPELWFGTLDANTRRFRFAVELKSHGDDGWTGTLLSMDEGGARFELTQVVSTADKLAFEIASTGAAFSATLNSNAKTANGKWRQRGKELDLTLEKVASLPTLNFKKLWTGRLDAVIQKLDIAIFELENGEVLLDSISQKASGFVGHMSRDKEAVTITFPGVGAEFRGSQDATGQTLTGQWKQGIVSLDLSLSRAERLQVEPPRRPQTPQPPFAYQVREIEFENAAAGIRLAGTLTLPHGAEHVPAVVLISGSGPQDRDETIAEHRPFAVIADHFTRAGLAVLRYDDRGVGESQGDFSQATSVEFASDTAAAVAFLRLQPEIDAAHIALCGHSEGGLIAPLVAADDPQIGGIVLMAASGVNGAQILTSQNRLLLAAAGTPPAELQRQLAIQQAFIDAALQSPLPTADAFKQQLEQSTVQHLSHLEAGSRDQLLDAAATQLLSPWFQYFLKHEPAEVLLRVKCPVLAICGEKDLQVDPTLNLPAIEGALQRSGNPDFRIETLPGLNHLFQPSSSGAVSEYGEIEQTIAPAVLELMTTWLLEHLIKN